MFESRLSSQYAVKFPFLLAPMVGLSHVAFRELVRSYVPKDLQVLMFTEMLSTRRLPSERLHTTNELKTSPNEQGFIPQLLGNEERFIKLSIDKLKTINPWGFDINMGCPVSHTLKHNWGVRLMGDQKYAAEVVTITKKYSDRPVSVKLRGSSGEEISIAELDSFTKHLEDAGADFLTIHARSKAQKHHGKADWSLVGEMARRRKIPVIANGAVQTADEAIHIMRDVGVDGVMVARAATARPWIFWQIAHKLGLRSSPHGYADDALPPMTLEEESREYFRAMLRYIDLLAMYFEDQEFCLDRVRFLTATGSKWFMFGHSFWKTTLKPKTLAALRDAVYEYSQKFEHRMYEKIEF
jgi:tRNA-dihydrouridine synthase